MCIVHTLYADVTKCFVAEMCVYIYYVPMCIILSGEGGSNLPGCLKVSGCSSPPNSLLQTPQQLL